MSGESNLSTFELSKCLIRISDDVRVVPKRTATETVYRLHCRSQGRYFQIGDTEYIFCSLLDGTRTLAEAITLTARAAPQDAFQEEQATSIVTWLIDSGLAIPVNREGRQLASALKKEGSRYQFNPFWTKIPLATPDRLLSFMLPIASWLFSPIMMLITALVWVWATIQLAGQWDEFTASSEQLFSSTNWVWLAAAWVALKVIHEFAHGLCCKRYGGTVREMGLIMILFAPMAYVDVTSSWSFTSRWKRIHVAAAGMLSEILIAGIAAILWTQVESETMRNLFYNIIIMAGISTLLFNANPLMRFDGYYILSDLLDIPNIYSDAQQAISRCTRRVLYGESPRGHSVDGWRGWFLLFYGASAFVWRILVTISMVIGASVLFEGLGLALAGVGVLLWFGMPVTKTITSWFKMLTHRPAMALRGAVLASIAVAGLSSLVCFVPCPGTASAPAIVEYTDLSIVRAGADGFVFRIDVEQGSFVNEGDILIVLRNDELESEVRDLEVAISQSRARQRASHNQGELAKSQVEKRNQQAMEERLATRRKQFDRLIIRATTSGNVVGRGFENLSGQYLKEGAEVLAIGNENEKELQVSIDQSVLDIARSAVGEQKTFRLHGTGIASGTVLNVSPRASDVPLNEALCAPFGGPLDVTAKQGDQDNDQQYELTQPRFLMTLELSDDVASGVRAGQTGCLHLGFGNRSIARVTYDSISTWLREKINYAKQSQQAFSGSARDVR